MKTHQEIDARSLWLHEVLAERMKQDPVLFERAKARLDWLIANRPAHEQVLLQAWKTVMDAGLDACIALMIEDTDRGQQLRQEGPFGVLFEPRERDALFKLWRERGESIKKTKQPHWHRRSRDD